MGIRDEECAISPPSHRAQKRLDVEDVHAFQALGAREVGLVVKKRPMYAKNVQLNQTRVTQLTKLPALQHLGLRKGTARRDRSLELPASSQKTNSDPKSSSKPTRDLLGILDDGVNVKQHDTPWDLEYRGTCLLQVLKNLRRLAPTVRTLPSGLTPRDAGFQAAQTQST